MTPISKQFLRNGHRCRPGGNYANASITMHSTANPKSTAKGERAWLDNPDNDRDASWHYCCDEKQIIQALPENEEAWHCRKTEGNRHSISIEICESGDRKKTLENVAEFVAGKLKAFGWNVDQIKTHNDWNGKICPRILIDKMYVVGGMDYDWFIGRVSDYLKGVEEVVEVRYNTLSDVPEWGKATIKKLIDKGAFADSRKLDLTFDTLRVYVSHDRIGLYK